MPIDNENSAKVPHAFGPTKGPSEAEAVIAALNDYGTTGELDSRKNSPNTTFKKKGG